MKYNTYFSVRKFYVVFSSDGTVLISGSLISIRSDNLRYHRPTCNVAAFIQCEMWSNLPYFALRGSEFCAHEAFRSLLSHYAASGTLSVRFENVCPQQKSLVLRKTPAIFREVLMRVPEFIHDSFQFGIRRLLNGLLCLSLRGCFSCLLCALSNFIFCLWYILYLSVHSKCGQPVMLL